MLTQITQLHCAVVPLLSEGSFSKELKMIMIMKSDGARCPSLDWLSVCRVGDHGDLTRTKPMHYVNYVNDTI